MASKQWKFASAGFIAGVAFVVACGQDVKTVAEEIARAINISFDNTGTELSATNVQGAIEELDTRTSGSGGGGSGGGTWLVKDKNGVVIFETPRPDKCGTNAPQFDNITADDTRVGYNQTLDKCTRWSPGDNLRIGYTSSDCSGTGFIAVNSNLDGRDTRPATDIATYIWFNSAIPTGFGSVTFTGPAVAGFLTSSHRDGTHGACDTDDSLIGPSARPVSISTVASVPFEFPLTQAPTWERN